jgi:AcrR family transcriptional regulator
MPTSREHVLDAVETLIAERGLDNVSIREVATAAGVSIGTVQYYCRSKDEMLVMAFEAVALRIAMRVDARDKTLPIGDQLFGGLLEHLPRVHRAIAGLANAERGSLPPGDRPALAVRRGLSRSGRHGRAAHR